jgi:hypothetical protein
VARTKFPSFGSPPPHPFSSSSVVAHHVANNRPHAQWASRLSPHEMSADAHRSHYSSGFVFGMPMTELESVHRPRFFSRSTLSCLLRTLRLLAAPLPLLVKLGCCVILKSKINYHVHRNQMTFAGKIKQIFDHLPLSA